MQAVHREFVEEIALSQYDEALGKVFYVGEINGWDDEDDSVCRYMNPPLPVIVEDTDEHSVIRWSDDKWLDPYWNVRPLHPGDNRLRGVRSLWVYGPSHNVVTGEVDWGKLRPETEDERRARIRNKIKGLFRCGL